MSKFADLCIPYKIADRTSIVRDIYKLGYRTIGIENYVESIGGKGERNILDPSTLLYDLDKIEIPSHGKPKMQQLSRITVKLEGESEIPSLRSSPITKYDIIAVKPTNEKMFLLACKTLQVDIISCDLTTEALPFMLKRQPISVALEQGKYFEILYCPAIRDEKARINIIRNAMKLVRACAGKSIVVSSSCQDRMELRGPLDVANLSRLFGFSENQAIACVSSNIDGLLLHCRSRKMGNSAVEVRLAVLPDDDEIKSHSMILEDSTIEENRKKVHLTKDTTDVKLGKRKPKSRNRKNKRIRTC